MGELFGIELARRVLGTAVHTKALQRLFELWPEADVQVTYGRYDGRRTTTVIILHHPGAYAAFGNVVRGKAHCDPSDQFVRRVGIDLAFRRALRKIPRGEAA